MTTFMDSLPSSDDGSPQFVTEMVTAINRVENMLKYNFNDKRLLEEALTHPSYGDATCYERLEFVGDAALGLAISNYVYLAYADIDPGYLSLLRAANISTEKLARVAVRHGLYRYIRHSASSLDEKVSDFISAVEEEDKTVIYGGVLKAPKVLADIVESVAAAVYVDCQFDLVRLWLIFRRLLEPIVTLDILQQHPVTLLYDICQKEGKKVTIKHSREREKNVSSIFVDGQFVVSASSHQTGNAKLHAAKAALGRMFHGESDASEGAKQKLHKLCGIERSPDCVIDLMTCIRQVENLLQYNFKNKMLLVEALTHPSYGNATSYQRLEFVGDAALGLAISNYVYLAYPDLDPGHLSLLRAANISTEKLARVAVRHGLYRYICHNASSLDEKVCEFISAVEQEDKTVVHGGVMKAPKMLADIVESVAAAVYVDCGFNLVHLWVVFRCLLEPIITLDILQLHPVTLLYELCQKKGKQVDIKHSRNGEENIASIFVDGQFIVSSASDQIENAKLRAAKAALEKMFHGESDASECVKQKLHKLCAKKKWAQPSHRVEKEIGPARERTYVCSVQIKLAETVLCVTGDEKSKRKDAESSAASMMLHDLQYSKDM